MDKIMSHPYVDYLRLYFVLLSLFAFTQSGCDASYRIRRDTDKLSYIVSFDCLVSSIKAIPNAKILSEKNMPKYNCKENQTGYEIMYDIDGQSIQLFACYEGDFLKTFTHGMGGWDGGQKTKNVPVTLEKMRMVEKSIEAHCNANGLSAKMHNNCINIECND